MSETVENILYLGPNSQLVKATLALSAPISAPSASFVNNFSCIDELQAALGERKYTHLICDIPINKTITDKIATDFPLLKTTYLTSADSENTAELSVAMQGLISDEVKASLDYLSIPIYFKNKEGQFLACNRYFSHLFGLTPAQVIGKTAADVVFAHLFDGIERIDQKIFTDQQVFFYECKIADQAGGERDVVFRKECVANGKIQIGMVFDVTELNEAKSLLEKERIMLRATADMSSDYIFFKDLQSRYLGCNKAYANFLDCPIQEIVGKKDDQLYERKQALLYQAQDRELISKNIAYLAEEYLINKNGVRHFIDIRKIPLQDSQGKVQCLIGVARNITEHHRVQQRLKIADTAFENSKENLLVSDQKGNIIAVNRSSCATSGFSKSELLGAHISIFKANQRENIEAALQDNKSWQGDITYHLKNGNIHFAWVEVYIVEHPKEGICNRIYSLIDLEQSKNTEQKIQFLSKHDPLTGLFNRIALFTRLEDAISRATHKQATMAVILVDINGFKGVNEEYGNNSGDALLKKIADRLKRCVFAKDTVARIGGDEFVIIVDELANEQDVAIVAQKIATQFERPLVIENIEISLSATIGISLCPDDGADVDSLIGNAEKALQSGKKSTSDAQFHFYTQQLTRHAHQQLALEGKLKQALQQDQFELYYQPQYDLNTRQIVAVESLPYWNHPQQGLVDPQRFLILAENSGLLVPIGLELLRKAARQALSWQQSKVNFGHIVINLSRIQLAQINFIGELQTILKETNCSSQWLEFAIEKEILHEASLDIQSNLANIKKMGVALTITNFGSSSAAVDFIKQLGVEKVKVSKQDIKNAGTSIVSEAILKSVNVFARTIGLQMVGDAADNAQQGALLSVAKLDSGQSSSVVKAMKASAATFYLRCNKRK